jgi:chromosome segregation ATPase
MDSDFRSAARQYVGVLERIVHAHHHRLTAADVEMLASAADDFRASFATPAEIEATHHAEELAARAVHAQLHLSEEARKGLVAELEESRRRESKLETEAEELRSQVEELQNQAKGARGTSHAGVLSPEQRTALAAIQGAAKALAELGPVVGQVCRAAAEAHEASASIAECSKTVAEAQSLVESPKGVR